MLPVLNLTAFPIPTPMPLPERFHQVPPPLRVVLWDHRLETCRQSLPFFLHVLLNQSRRWHRNRARSERQRDCVESRAAFNVEALGTKEPSGIDIAGVDDCAATSIVTRSTAIFANGSHRTREMGAAEPCYPPSLPSNTNALPAASSSTQGAIVRLAPVGEVAAKWRRRRDEAKALSSIAPLERVCDEVLADLGAIQDDFERDVLTLGEAAAESGYSTDHIRRLIRDGKLPNAGRRHSPLVRRGDLPMKPGHLRSGVLGINNAAPSREQIVRAVVTSALGVNDGQDT